MLRLLRLKIKCLVFLAYIRMLLLMPLIIKMLILINVNVLDISFDLMQVDVFLSVGSGFGKNVIVFNADMSSLLHIDDKKMS